MVRNGSSGQIRTAPHRAGAQHVCVGEHFACAEEEDRDIEVRDREPALEDALLLGERTAVVGAGSYRVDTSNLRARHDHG